MIAQVHHKLYSDRAASRVAGEDNVGRRYAEICSGTVSFSSDTRTRGQEAALTLSQVIVSVHGVQQRVGEDRLGRQPVVDRCGRKPSELTGPVRGSRKHNSP